jgi:hypothetical protein
MNFQCQELSEEVPLIFMREVLVILLFWFMVGGGIV